MSVREKIDTELATETIDEVVKVAKAILKDINVAQQKRVVWIERRQTERKDLADLATKVYAAAELQNLEELKKLSKEVSAIAGTSGLEAYRRKYGKVVTIVDECDEEYGG